MSTAAIVLGILGVGLWLFGAWRSLSSLRRGRGDNWSTAISDKAWSGVYLMFTASFILWVAGAFAKSVAP